jgi:uncharacterized protein GlcG (DUF336 family)
MARLTLTIVDLLLAQQMCAAARAQAATIGALVSVAVVDAGGHLIAFERMDGAEIAGPTLARDKAYTAVAHRSPTDALTPLTAPGGALAGMNTADGGRYVCFGGGLPFWSAGLVVGAVGVSGGSTEQDVACAGAAAVLFEQADAAPGDPGAS